MHIEAGTSYIVAGTGAPWDGISDPLPGEHFDSAQYRWVAEDVVVVEDDVADVNADAELDP